MRLDQDLLSSRLADALEDLDVDDGEWIADQLVPVILAHLTEEADVIEDPLYGDDEPVDDDEEV